MEQIELFVNKTVEQNAALYYEKSKKFKKKIEGVNEIIRKSKDKLKIIEKKSLEEEKRLAVEEQEQERLVQKSKEKKWYEKYRWFVSSDGFMVIGGRDATTNEVIIKKHTEDDDFVLHTDMAGSPFFIIKTEGKKVPESTLKQAADATCTFSRAWKLGLSSQQVFYVKPEQVSKTAQSGEYLTKGAFMIRGKTNYLDNEINCAIGLTDDDKIMCAPLEAVKKHCKKYLKVEHGNLKPSDAAKKVKAEIGGDLDEIIRALPSGEMKLVKQ